MELPGGFWGKPKPKLNDLDMGYRDPGKKEVSMRYIRPIKLI